MLDLVQHAINEKYKTLLQKKRPRQVQQHAQSQARARLVSSDMINSETGCNDQGGSVGPPTGALAVASKRIVEGMESESAVLSNACSQGGRPMDSSEGVSGIPTSTSSSMSSSGASDIGSDSGSDSDYREPRSREKHITKKRRVGRRNSSNLPASSTNITTSATASYRRLPVHSINVSGRQEATSRDRHRQKSSQKGLDEVVNIWEEHEENEEAMEQRSSNSGRVNDKVVGGEVGLKVIRFDGAMNQVQRNAALTDFHSNPNAKILLISLKWVIL